MSDLHDRANDALRKTAASGTILAEMVQGLHEDDVLRSLADRVMGHYEEYKRLAEEASR